MSLYRTVIARFRRLPLAPVPVRIEQTPQTLHFWPMMAAGALAFGAALVPAPQASAQGLTLLNVSYDPTRELYREYNAWFTDWWVAQGDPRPTIQTSHG